MSYDETLTALYPTAVTVVEFARWSADALAPHGFDRYNSLTLVGACRDELMFEVEHGLRDVWGPGFDVSALGGMVFLGRTGMAAAANHAPGLDGRRRYVVFVLPHIGIGPAGAIGEVERLGQTEPSAACGALATLHRELTRGDGPDPTVLDHHDIEMSMLRRELVAMLGGAAAPTLPGLTDLARRRATDTMVALTDHLVHASDADVAMISGVVVHGPHEDHVMVAEAWASIGGDPVRRPLDLPTPTPRTIPA